MTRCASISDAAPCFFESLTLAPLCQGFALRTIKGEAVPHNYNLIEAQPHL